MYRPGDIVEINQTIPNIKARKFRAIVFKTSMSRAGLVLHVRCDKRLVRHGTNHIPILAKDVRKVIS